jgi:fibronectin type 3 domain-containing protein
LACVEVFVPCDIIIELSLEEIGDNEVYLSWIPEFENTYFRIYRNAYIYDEIKGNSYTDKDIIPNEKYCYYVTAICGGNAESEPSNTVCINGESINELSNQINIYPNPTTGELKVTSNGLRVTSVEIFDMMGRVQKAEGRKQNGEKLPLQNGEDWGEVNISHLPNGVYFLKITTETGVVTRKVVKE